MKHNHKLGKKKPQHLLKYLFFRQVLQKKQKGYGMQWGENNPEPQI